MKQKTSFLQALKNMPNKNKKYEEGKNKLKNMMKNGESGKNARLTMLKIKLLDKNRKRD